MTGTTGNLRFRFFGIAAATLLVMLVGLYATHSFLRYQEADNLARRNGGTLATQAEMQHLRLLMTLDLFHMSENDVRRPDLEGGFEQLRRRLRAILDRAESEALRRNADVVPMVRKLQSDLASLQPLLAVLAPGDSDAYRRLRAALEAMGPDLDRLTRLSVQATPADLTEQRDSFGQTLFLLMFLVLSLGSVLALLLLREMRLGERRTRLLEAVLDNMESGLVAFDSDRRIVIANRRFGALSGLPERLTAIGTTFEEIVRYNSSRGLYGRGRVEGHVEMFNDAFDAGNPVRMMRPQSDGRILEMRLNPMPDGGIVVTYDDVTQVKRTERELMAARDAAEAASEAKTGFLANMSHELRTPLNAILGFSEIMSHELMGPMPQRYREYSDMIRQSGQHLLSLIDDVLDLSKVEAGKLTVSEGEVELQATVDFALTTLATEIGKAHLQVTRRIAEPLPRLRGDQRMCRQVALNLLSNAVKFTPDGGRIEVALDLLASGAIVLAVRDTGIGIPREQIERVLEPFHQVEDVLVRRRRGSGLGLPLTRKLMELHGGRLEIASEHGRGTSVRAVFPAERTLNPALQARRAALPSRPAA